MWKILIDRIEPFLKSIPKSKILTVLGLPVYWTLVQRASFIFLQPNRIFSTQWSSFEEKFCSKNIYLKLLYLPYVYRTLTHVTWVMLVTIFIIIMCRHFCCKQLCLRSEHEKLEKELLMAKGKIEEMEKEMRSLKESQAGFRSHNSNSRLPN